MKAGIPLTDEDRWPWLRAIAAREDELQAAGQSAVVACSALKRAYRDILNRGPRRHGVDLPTRLEGVDRGADAGEAGAFHATGAAGQPVRDPGGAGC